MKAAPGSPLAAARMRAHAAFDPSWQSGLMTRSQAYNWLSQKLGIPKSECHMLLFDIAMCNLVVETCEANPKICPPGFDFEDIS